MANLTSTALDQGSVQVSGCEFKDELVTFAGAATLAEGTILARLADTLAVVASAVTGTGTGAITLASVVEGPIVPLVGAYAVTCVLAVANGGKFKLVDPNGAIVADDLEMTVGSGATTRFEVGGLTWSITDATDFVAGDSFTLTVSANGKMVPYAAGGAGGAQFPKAVLAKALTAAGAGDLPTRVIISGKVAKDRLVINGGGSIGDALLDQLRSFGINAVPVQQLGRADN